MNSHHDTRLIGIILALTLLQGPWAFATCHMINQWNILQGPSREAVCAAALHRGMIFVGSDRGVEVLAPHQKRWKLVNRGLVKDEMFGYGIRTFQHAGESLLIGTYEGLYRLDERRNQWKSYGPASYVHVGEDEAEGDLLPMDQVSTILAWGETLFVSRSGNTDVCGFFSWSPGETLWTILDPDDACYVFEWSAIYDDMPIFFNSSSIVAWDIKARQFSTVIHALAGTAHFIVHENTLLQFVDGLTHMYVKNTVQWLPIAGWWSHTGETSGKIITHASLHHEQLLLGTEDGNILLQNCAQ